MDPIKKNLKWHILVTLFLASVLIWYAVLAEERNGIMTVVFLDVGQGDAIFIDAPNGNQMLIDGGSNRQVLSELSKVMPFYDRSIDVVVATHPDTDHIGGLPGILTRYEVGMVIEPGVKSEAAVYKEFERIIEEKNIKKVFAQRGMRLSLSDGVYLLILFPDRDVSNSDSNDASVVAKLIYGDTSFLFTGDSPKKIEEYLAFVNSESLNVDVLKAGHHGSKTSSSELFIGYTSPEYAVISVGKDNRYGHPHKEVLDIFKNFKISVLRTDFLGSVIMSSDGENIVLK